MIRSRSGGLVGADFDALAMLNAIARRAMQSRNAACFRIGFGQCDGHPVMRPAFSVVPGSGFLTASEDLDDAHRAAAVGAWLSQGERDRLSAWRIILFGRFRSKQS
jgi:hypothetical protein